MKLLVLVCLLSLVGLSIAGTDLHPRGCVWVMGRCQKDCEEGTHGYSIPCPGHIVPEPTCDEPNPVEQEATACDYSACYCDAPTVRDASGKCVALEQCPKKQ